MAHSFGLYGDGIRFWLFVANHSDLESFLVVHTLLQQDDIIEKDSGRWQDMWQIAQT